MRFELTLSQLISSTMLLDPLYNGVYFFLRNPGRGSKQADLARGKIKPLP